MSDNESVLTDYRLIKTDDHGMHDMHGMHNITNFADPDPLLIDIADCSSLDELHPVLDDHDHSVADVQPRRLYQMSKVVNDIDVSDQSEHFSYLPQESSYHSEVSAQSIHSSHENENIKKSTEKSNLHKYTISVLPNYINVFSEGLHLDSNNYVESSDLQQFLAALKVRDFNYLESRGFDARALKFKDVIGQSPTSYSIREPLIMTSSRFANDMLEIYAMTLAKNIPFTEYLTNSLIAGLSQDLSQTQIFRLEIMSTNVSQYLQRYRPINTGADLAIISIDDLTKIVNGLTVDLEQMSIMNQICYHAQMMARYHQWQYLVPHPDQVSYHIEQARLTKRNPHHFSVKLLNNRIMTRLSSAKLEKTKLEKIKLEKSSYPSYPSEIATVAGAAITLLKIWLEPNTEMDVHEVQNGKLLNSGKKTSVVEELDTLAGNFAMSEVWAADNYRSSAIAGLKLGEKIALTCWPELNNRYQKVSVKKLIRKFSGKLIHV